MKKELVKAVTKFIEVATEEDLMKLAQALGNITIDKLNKFMEENENE